MLAFATVAFLIQCIPARVNYGMAIDRQPKTGHLSQRVSTTERNGLKKSMINTRRSDERPATLASKLGSAQRFHLVKFLGLSRPYKMVNASGFRGVSVRLRLDSLP